MSSGGFVSVAVLCAWVAVLPAARAHRLDEYLQATLLSIDTGRVDLQIDLTPGVAIASKVFGWIDTNHDGAISEAEGKAYARQMLGSVAEGRWCAGIDPVGRKPLPGFSRDKPRRKDHPAAGNRESSGSRGGPSPAFIPEHAPDRVECLPRKRPGSRKPPPSTWRGAARFRAARTHDGIQRRCGFKVVWNCVSADWVRDSRPVGFAIRLRTCTGSQ
jgi:hypothetical protein